jgi:hypothetical protein
MNILCFLIPFLDPLRIKILGELCTGEILIPILGVFTFRKSIYILKENYFLKLFAILILIYLTCQYSTDIYRDTTNDDRFKGLAKISITFISFITFIGAFWDNPRGILFFFWGIASSLIPAMFVTDQSYQLDSESWKWLYSMPLTVGMFLLSGNLLQRKFLNHDSKYIVYGTIILFSLTSFFLNYRSLAGLTLVSGFILFYLFNRGKYVIKNTKSAINLFIILIIISSIILLFYKWGASNGYLGEKALAKYEYQSDESGDFNLSSGRTELFFSLEKILESPLIGWGSWAKDREYVLGRYRELQGDKPVWFPDGQEGLIPSHSHIFGGWMEAGIGGGLFWLIFFILLARNIPFISFQKFGILMPILIYITVLELWDIVFSPYGAGRRDYVGAILAIQCFTAVKIGYTRIMEILPKYIYIKT